MAIKMYKQYLRLSKPEKNVICVSILPKTENIALKTHLTTKYVK